MTQRRLRMVPRVVAQDLSHFLQRWPRTLARASPVGNSSCSFLLSFFLPRTVKFSVRAEKKAVEVLRA